MSDLAILRSFLAVYRAGSISRAAVELNVAQPTVSGHIKALESDLGRPLFDRRPRGVDPRAAAHELASAVSHHIDALDGVLYGDLIGRSRRSGVLYLGGPSEFMGAVVLPALAPLVKRGVRLRATLGVDEPIARLLLDGDLDIAVLTKPSDDPALEVESMRGEEYLLVASPTRAARLAGVPEGKAGADLLLDEPMIVFAESLPLVREYWRGVFDTRWVGSPAVVANSLPVVAALVRRDMGIAVLPRHVCERSLELGEMQVVLEPKVPPRNTLYLAWRAGSAVNPGIRWAHELLHDLRGDSR